MAQLIELLGVASMPAISWAGSDGTIRTMTNTTVTTPQSTKTASSTRRIV